MKVSIRPCIPPVAFPLSFMDYPKSTELVIPSGLSFLAGVQLLMG